MRAEERQKLLTRYTALLARWAVSPCVRRALATEPRHVFVERGVYLPDGHGGWGHRNIGLLEHIYSDRQLVVKTSPLVSRSQPALLAIMLELLDLSPGVRVLEIGTGTGYFAALLAEMGGNPNLVTTSEIQPDVAA